LPEASLVTQRCTQEEVGELPKARSMAGSEFTLAMGLGRLGIPSSFIMRIPDNPYGHALRDIAREQRMRL
jgi:sugar/nucleoside kinase (ribokinase family)